MGEILSPRLGLMLEQGIDGEDFWDVCCDHGYLGEAALRHGRYSRVYFVDRVPHIIAQLKDRLDDHAAARFIAAKAEEIVEPLKGTVVIAGVGGYTLIKILEAWSEKKILRAKRLILNPLTHVEQLRAFLEVWPEYQESKALLAREKNRDREVLVLEGRF